MLHRDSGFDTLPCGETFCRAGVFWGIMLDVEAGSVVDAWGDIDMISGFEQYWHFRFADLMEGFTADDLPMGLRGATAESRRTTIGMQISVA